MTTVTVKIAGILQKHVNIMQVFKYWNFVEK